MNAPFSPTGADLQSAPGIEYDEIRKRPGGTAKAAITCIDYSPGNVWVQKVEDLSGFLIQHRPEWSVVRWISVVGLTDMEAIHALATKYQLHPLAVEDVLDARQRPKIEAYGGEDSELQARLFLVTRMLHLHEGELQHEQLSIFLGHRTVLTFQESRDDYWEPIRQRIRMKGSRLRGNAIQHSLSKLLPAYREALILVDIEGLSYEEGSVAARVPVGTVKSRLARARLQMRCTLQGYRDILPAQFTLGNTKSLYLIPYITPT